MKAEPMAQGVLSKQGIFENKEKGDVRMENKYFFNWMD